MVTDDLDFTNNIDEYSFSGGVAELIYGRNGNYNDIGHILADKIKSQTCKLASPVIEPVNKIRATVIGAGALLQGSSHCLLPKIRIIC